jgi:hypothetical protein
MIPRNAIIVLAAFVLLLGAGPTTQESNLLSNGGFEKGLDGWITGNDYEMSHLSPDAKHTGTRGLRVTDEDTQHGSSLATQKFVAKPGQTFVVKFFAKRIKEGGISVYIQFFDRAGKSLSTQDQKNSTGVKKGDDAESWRQYISDPAVAPENAATVRVFIHSTNADTGTVDFDDFVFYEQK